METSKLSLIPRKPPTAKGIQDVSVTPEQLIQTLNPFISKQILDEWRDEKDAANVAKPSSETLKKYIKAVEGLEYKYSRELNITPGDLSPIVSIKKFLTFDKGLRRSTWNLYRYSLLHVYSEREKIWRQKGLPQESLVTALAALIVFSKRPVPENISDKGEHIRSIPLNFFMELVTHLAVGYSARSKISRAAQSTAVASLATGLRPGEWVHSELRDAWPEEMPDGQDPKGWLAIVVPTSKRKNYEVEWIRTILIQPGVTQNHIRQHYSDLMESLNKTSANPGEYYLTRCSRMLKQAAMDLWPKNPERWITLRTLRGQARANILAAYGADVCAAMMGHSISKGDRFYSGLRSAYDVRGKMAEGLTPVPGLDCLRKAAEFSAAEQISDTERQFVGGEAVDSQ